MRNNTSLQTRRYIDPSMPALFRYRFLITVFLLAAVLFVGGASATTYEADTTANFTTNLSAAAASGDTILITGDFTVSNVTIDKEITIRSDVPHTLTASSSRLFYITSSGNLTLGDGVTLTNGSVDNGGAVYMSPGSTFVMSGGTISDNTATSNGGGVFVNSSTFTMTGGTIAGNSGPSFGGGVCVNAGGTFNMSGDSTISSNSGTDGGGVCVNAGGTFNMNDGTIVENQGSWGGGVFMNGGTFNMNSGNISGNNAPNNGGGMYLGAGTVNMNGGNITNNTASNGGGAVYVIDGTFNMNGSAIVDADNDLYLPSGKFITVTGNLDTSAGALNITPASTVVNGTPIVTYGSFSIPDTWTNNFALNTTWANQYSFSLINSSNELLLITNCTVRFYNETDVVYDTQYAFSGSLITEPSPAPTKTGYTFSGWNNTTSGNNTPWSFSTDRVTVNPTNLSANWTVNTYNISYSSNYGTPTITNQSVTYNTSVTLLGLEVFSRPGYTLANWTDQSDGGGSSYAMNGTYGTYLLTDNLTLYANWTANTYNISYSSNYGTPTITNQSVTYNTSVTLLGLEVFSRPGYTLANWTNQSDGGGSSYAMNGTYGTYLLTDNLTLYANWTANTYNISYSSNYGTPTITNQSVTYNTSVTLLGLEVFSRPGYTLANWTNQSDGGGGSYAMNGTYGTYLLTDNLTLYANWTNITYNVSFDANGGTGTMANQSFTYDTPQDLTPNNFTKVGGVFAGWATTAGGAVTYTDNENVNNLTNVSGATVTLYANWTANTYNITYLNNGGSGTIANQSVIFNTTVILNDGSNLSRTGYTLARWATVSDGSGTSYGLGSTVSPYLVADNLTLYAIWTANPTSSSGDGGNDGNNADYGPVSLNGTFTTNDGNLTLYYPAGSNIMVTVFKDYFNGAEKPSGISYLVVYDVHSTADSGTSVTLVFRVNASLLEAKGLTPEDISILHYYDGEWHQMTIKSIDLVDGAYQFTVTSTHTSPFMIAYNVDGTWFPIEDTATPTTTPTSTPTGIGPTSTTTPTPTEPTSSPVPLVGIIAGLGAAGLLLRRR